MLGQPALTDQAPRDLADDIDALPLENGVFQRLHRADAISCDMLQDIKVTC